MLLTGWHLIDPPQRPLRLPTEVIVILGADWATHSFQFFDRLVVVLDVIHIETHLRIIRGNTCSESLLLVAAGRCQVALLQGRLTFVVPDVGLLGRMWLIKTMLLTGRRLILLEVGLVEALCDFLARIIRDFAESRCALPRRCRVVQISRLPLL